MKPERAKDLNLRRVGGCHSIVIYWTYGEVNPVNSIMQNHYPTLQLRQALREQLMEIVTDGNLTFVVFDGYRVP